MSLVNPALLFGELKRRRVFRALIGYGIAAFAVLQIIEPVMHGLHWPENVLSYVVVSLAVGFPIIVSLAWIFDVKAGRIERTAPAAEGLTGGRLVFFLVVIGVLAATPGTIWYFAVRGIARRPATSTASSAQVAPSVAVLPFTDLSPQKDQEYFSDGLAEEILDALAHVEGLHVSARTSSFNFKGKNEELSVIAAKLHVASVLEGSVRKEGNRVRVTAQLISAADGYHLWSQKFERDLTGIFAVQDEVARAVVDALKVKLLPGRGSAGKEHGTTKPEVYTQYLLGQQLARRQSWPRAVEAYEKALAVDAGYAPAWAGLALAVFWSIPGDVPLTASLDIKERALAAAEKAVALDPDLPEAYHARGEIRRMYKWDWAGAQVDYERALALNPGHGDIVLNYAHLLASLGRLQEGIAAKRRATELDPLNSATWGGLAYMYVSTGHPDLARVALNRALEIDPEFPGGLWLQGMASLFEGDPRAALASYERIPEDDDRIWGIAIAQYELGRPKESQEALDTFIDRWSQRYAYSISQVYAMRGDGDRAFEWLNRAYAQRSTGMPVLKYDPFLRKIRNDDRYRALLKKVNLPVD